jgi:UDP-N-acetylmuramyl pentapeptide phosphotransferase/UDP-N-acetylglucosamine-1-phosphate transferase
VPFLIAFAVAVVLTPIAAHVGAAMGLVDDPTGDPLKIHRSPVPVLGGVAVVVATLVGSTGRSDFPSAAVVIAVGIALAAGLADDVHPLTPGVQALLQAAAGVVLAAGLGIGGAGLVGVAAVLLLVLACANSVNFVDGQDGLAGGLAATASVGLAVVADSALGAAAAGALVAFLFWNRPPARIFLGNGGAYACGTVLAVLTLQAIERHGWGGVIAAGLCLAVFAFELFFTVARRLVSGSLTSGDRLHSYDLLARDRPRGRVLLGFWGAGAAAAALGVATTEFSVAAATAIAAIVCGAAAFAAWRIWAVNLRPPKAVAGRSARPLLAEKPHG